MQKRKPNKSKSFARGKETVRSNSEDSASPSPSPSDRRKKVRWEEKSAPEDSEDIDPEDETESSEKVLKKWLSFPHFFNAD